MQPDDLSDCREEKGTKDTEERGDFPLPIYCPLGTGSSPRLSPYVVSGFHRISTGFFTGPDPACCLGKGTMRICKRPVGMVRAFI